MDNCHLRIELFDSDYLNIVELNTTGDDENYVKGDDESKYLQSEVFNIFISSFENSNRLYEFYGATKYDIRKIVPLKNELTNKLEQLKNMETQNDFKNHIEQIFLGSEFIDKLQQHDPHWEKNWKQYRDKLLDVNRGLIAITDTCLDEQRVLWVIGY
jgi:hypothetical protein